MPRVLWCVQSVFRQRASYFLSRIIILKTKRLCYV